MSGSSFTSGIVLLNWLKRSAAKFGDWFKSNEVSFVSTWLLLCLLNLSQGMADKKQLLFKDTNGKIALEQVAQNEGSFEPSKYL